MAYISGDETVNQKIKEWLKWDKNEVTRKEIEDLVKAEDVVELKKRFDSRIAFGTAGLRGRMCAGYSMMNDLVIIQTSQGLGKYLLEVYGSDTTSGIAIGFDGRHNSKRWAHILANVMSNLGIPVRLFADYAATPILAFATKHLKCVCGVVITASHNPKQDNGFKVYWSNGSQIISPHDKNISAHIMSNLEPLEASWHIEDVETRPNITDPSEIVLEEYFKLLADFSLHRDRNTTTALRPVYTAMHGVGTPFVRRAVTAFGFPSLHEVAEQCSPDPEFPTVVFPNPEEGKSSLDLSIRLAESVSSTLVLANDPDADRFATAEKQPDGSWKVFSGNELGALFGWWMIKCYKETHPQSTKKAYLLSSAVSSKILQSMAEKEGLHFIETLTGFKWMGNKAAELIDDGCDVIMAFEEAIGYMLGTLNYDKDGISAAVIFYELTNYLYEHEKTTLTSKLCEIYKQYGVHMSYNTYYICHDPVTINKIFTRIRRWENGQEHSYPATIGSLKVEQVRDLTTGYDNSQPDNKAILPVSGSSHMITFTMTSDLIGKVVCTLRTSGTEPKVKIYSETQTEPGVERDAEEIRTSLTSSIISLMEELLEPAKNGLVPRKDD